MTYDAVILGAGPAGLAVAHAMSRAGASLKVLEPAGRVGGSIRTVREDGWLVETGPNTLQLEGPEDEALLAAYGLGGVMQAADLRSARRYVFAHGKLHGLGGCGNLIGPLDEGLIVGRKHRDQAEAQVDSPGQPVLHLLEYIANDRFQGRNQVVGDVLGGVVELGRHQKAGRRPWAKAADDINHEVRVLGHAPTVGPLGLAVPAGVPGETEGDILDFDVERRRFDEI